MTVYESIKNRLVEISRLTLPNFKIFAESIEKLNDIVKKTKIKDYVYIEVIPVSNKPIGFFTERIILVDILIHYSEETTKSYWDIWEKLDLAIKPYLSFAGRHITIPDTNFTIVDYTLHYTFRFSFTDSNQEDTEEQLSYFENMKI